MARIHSKSLRLRIALACCYLALGSIHFVAAFVLAWFAKGDARLFLLAGMLIAGWASVVATAQTVTMRELASFWKIPGKQ